MADEPCRAPELAEPHHGLGPHTTAAVLAALASTQLGPDAETVVQYASALSPWWRGRRCGAGGGPPRCHARTDVLEAASPPESIATTWSTSATSEDESAAMPTAQPPSGHARRRPRHRRC